MFSLVLQRSLLTPYSSYLNFKDLANMAIADCGKEKTFTISKKNIDSANIKKGSFLIQDFLNYVKPKSFTCGVDFENTTISPCENFIVTKAEDDIIRVTNIVSEEVVKEIKHQKSVTYAVMSSCSNYLATFSENESIEGPIIKIIGMHNNNDNFEWTHNSDVDFPNIAIFSPKNNYLASVTICGNTFIINLETKKIYMEINNVRSPKFSSCGNYFVFKDIESDEVKVANLKEGTILTEIDRELSDVSSIKFSSCGNYFVFKGLN